MKILSAITDNLYLTVGLFCLVMLMSELTYSRRGLHYSTDISGNEAMRQHLLNKQYQLHRREGVDIPGINRRIARCHCAVIVAAGGLMLVNLFAGTVFFLIGNMASTYLLIRKIGKEYSTFPFKQSH